MVNVYVCTSYIPTRKHTQTYAHISPTKQHKSDEGSL